MPATHSEIINADLLEFVTGIRAKLASAA
jgi:hypothetical protein